MDKAAIIYARVSTLAQAEEELPIESQLEVCRRKAAELDAVVLREFVDAGISGRTDQRRAFQDALAFCRMNRVDYFVVWNTARFARVVLGPGQRLLVWQHIGKGGFVSHRERVGEADVCKGIVRKRFQDLLEIADGSSNLVRFERFKGRPPLDPCAVRR